LQEEKGGGYTSLSTNNDNSNSNDGNAVTRCRMGWKMIEGERSWEEEIIAAVHLRRVGYWQGQWGLVQRQLWMRAAIDNKVVLPSVRM
jgi:hypothetical protein